jgi:hypothetical protein
MSMSDLAKRWTFSFLALLAACAGGSGGGGVARVTDSAGVTLVESPGADIPLPWTLSEVRRIGGADTGAAAFTRAGPWNVAADPARGRIYVLDGQAKQVAVFDTAGTLLRVMGREGGGPGELRFPQLIWVLADGTVEVLDIIKGGLVRFGPEGDILAEQSLTGDFPEGKPHRSGDTLYLVRRTSEGTEQHQRFQIHTPADTTVLLAQSAPLPGMARFACMAINMPRLFTPQIRMAGSGGRVAASPQVPYLVQLYEGGRLVRSVRRAVNPLPADRAAIARRYPEGMRFLGGAGGCTVQAAELEEKLGAAPEVPLIEALALAPDGTLWVQRYTFEDEPPRVDVFDAEGIYRGTLTGRGLPLGFIGDLVLFGEEDPSTGVERIVLLRLAR